MRGRRQGRRVVSSVVATVVAAGVLVGAAGTASAKVPKPAFFGVFNYSNFVVHAEQAAEFHLQMINATTCTITSVPAPITGGKSADCSGGHFDAYLYFPKDRATKDAKYKVAVTLVGPGGTKVKKFTVKVVPGAGGATGQVIQTVTAGDGVNGVSSDGQDVWVTNFNDGTVTQLDATSGAYVRTISAGAGADGVASDGVHVWVTNYNANTVTEIDCATGTVVRTIAVGSHPYGVSSDSTHVWVANSSAGTVTEINAATGAVVATIAVGASPYGVSADGTNVWVANHDDYTVSRISASSGAVVQTVSLSCDPYGISSDGGQVFTSVCGPMGGVDLLSATGSSIGTVIDAVDFTVLGFPQPGYPYGVCSDGTHIWVTDRANAQVVIIDRTNGLVTGTVPVGPDPLSVSSDGTHVWVTNWDNGGGTTVTELSAV